MVDDPARAFLERFVLPLVAGGEVHVGAPIRQGQVADLARAAEAASDVAMAIEDARTAVTSTWVVRPPEIFLDEEQLAMCAGLHNALFLAHPRVDRWTVTDRARRRVADTSLSLVAQPLTTQRDRLLARHALLHHLLDLRRVDTKVSWWTGSAVFRGQAAPARLTAWPGLRRVEEHHTTVGFDELLTAPDVAPVIAALVRRTPLTQLVTAHPAAPPVHWEDAAAALRDPELARAVAYQVIAGAGVGAPTDPADVVAGPARLTAAFEQMLERSPAEADVRAIAAFLVHLQALLLLGEPARADEASALVTGALADRGGTRPRGVAAFFALPAALAAVDPRLAVPPGLGDGGDARPSRRDGDVARWRARQAEIARVVGDGVAAAIAARLRRHLRGAPAVVDLAPAADAPAAGPAADADVL